MGSAVIVDIIGSSIIAAFLLLMVLSLNGTIAQVTFTTGNELNVQENLVAGVNLIENDFRQLGWCADPSKIADPTKAVLSATRNSFKFLTDVDANGILDSVEYVFDTTAVIPASPNPHDRVLYRIINSSAQPLYLGFVHFDFTYFNVLGDSIPFPIVQPKEIYEMQLSIALESPSAYDTDYSYAYWRQLRLNSRNLRNR